MATLLYVDDEESIGRVVTRYFAKRGDTVLLAKSIAEAQVHLAEREPDVIFIDVWLGRESGFELMNWIEESRPTLALRVTFVTGELAPTAEHSRLWPTLGRPVIEKPFDLAQLASQVEDAERRVRG